MQNQETFDKHFKNLAVSNQLQPLLERYEEWTSPANFSWSERLLLRDSICNPTIQLWLQACLRAVETNNTAWLKFYENYDGGDERRFPLNTLEANEFGKKRTHAAVCLANCALAAAILKTASHDAATQFVACFENAVTHWQKSGNSRLTTPLKSQAPPPLRSIEYFLDEVKANYASANEEFEISPVVILIRHFLRIDTECFPQSPSGTAMFPLVGPKGTVIALLEIHRCDHGTGRLYRDAINSSFIVTDKEFYESLQTAFEYVKAQNSDVRNYDFYWRVRIWNKKNSGPLLEAWLQKQSAGLAATIAVNDSIRNSNLGAGYLFTGKINNDGTIGVVADLLDKVHIAEANDLPIFIPKFHEQNGEVTKIVSQSEKVRLASSFVDVTQIIQSERQALKDEENRKLWKRRKLTLGIVTVVIALISIAVLLAQTSSLEKQRRQVAEEKRRVAENETEKLKDLTNKLNTKNEELNTANTLLDKANRELDRKNKKLVDTNADLEVAKEEAVENEQEAQKQRQLAQASKQAAIASQFATEGYKRLAHGDKSGAQTYFAKALTFDDQEDYRSGLLSAYFDSGNNSYKLAWASDLDGDSRYCCLKTAISHSGVFLATTTADVRGVRIITTDEGREVSAVQLERRIENIALSANGDLLATKTADGQVRVWKTASREKIIEYSTKPDKSQNSLAFSDDSSYLAVVSGTHTVLVTEIASGRTVKKVDNSEKFPDAKISYVCFIAGDYVAYSFNHGPILIAPVKSSDTQTQINASAQYFGLGYTQRGDLVTSDGDITVYPDIKDKLRLSSLPASEYIHQKVRSDWFLASNSSVPYYATTGDNGIIHIRMGTELISQVAFPMGKPANLMLGKNGLVIFQNNEGKVFCWFPIPGEFKKLRDYGDAAYEAGNPRLLNIDGKKLQVKDTGSERIVFTLDMQVPEGLQPAASISENGKDLAVSEDLQSIDIYDVDTGRKNFHVKLSDSDAEQILLMRFSSNNKKIVIARSKSIVVVSPESNKVLGTIKFPLTFSELFFVYSVSFSPRDTFLVVQTENSINLFDASTFELKHSIPFENPKCYLQDSECSWFAVSPDEKFVGVTQRSGGIVQIWNLDATRHLVDVIATGAQSPEMAVGAAFTSDSRYFIWSSGNSGRIHSYDLLQNKKLPDFPIDEGIKDLGMTKANQLLVNGSENYYLGSSDFISLMTGKPSDINSRITTKTGFRIASSEPLLYSQDELDLLLSHNRPTNELFAVDRNGSDVKSLEMFGGVQLIRPPIIRPNSSSWKGNVPNQVSTTPRRPPDEKPTEAKGIKCPTGFFMPVFNPFPIAFDDGNTPLCSDVPLLDVAEDNGMPIFSRSMEQYLSRRRFKGARGIVVLLFMDNGAFSNPISYIAKNVKISTALEREGNVYKLTATYTGDNVAPASASIFIEVEPDERLEVIPNSGSMYDYVGRVILDRQRLNLGNTTYTVGDLDPDLQYSLFFSYGIAIKRNGN